MNRKFSRDVCKQLGHYVYRLVDPRNGKTFYVGKGQRNRVFDHVKMALKFRKICDTDTNEYETEQSEKYEVIKSIIAAGLEVIPIIHRHGIRDSKTAFAIEGALIDAYPGLTNIRAGHGNLEFGCAHADEVQRKYQAEEAKLESNKFIIIKIRQATIDDRGSVYEAVRRSWRINLTRAKDKLVIASVYSIIKDVFIVDNWHKYHGGSDDGRWCFDGHSVATQYQELIGKRIPDQFVGKGAASPIRYV